MKAKEIVESGAIADRLRGRDTLPRTEPRRSRAIAAEAEWLARRFRHMGLILAFGAKADAANILYPRKPRGSEVGS